MESEQVAEMASQLQAAGALIDSLEAEVAGLREDLQRSRLAVRAAQAEVESRELRIQDQEEAIAALERQAVDLRSELDEMRLANFSGEADLHEEYRDRLASQQEESERRLAALQAQREADNRSLRERHKDEMEALESEFTTRMHAREEKHKTALAVMQEKLEGLQMQLDTVTRIFHQRLTELRQSGLKDKAAAEERLQKVLEDHAGQKNRLERRISDLQAELESSGAEKSHLIRELKNSLTHAEELKQQLQGELSKQHEQEVLELRNHIKELDAGSILARERAKKLEAELDNTRLEKLQVAERLERALQEIHELSSPGQRLRAGLSLFNQTGHAQAVASISKTLGLPKVHVGLDDSLPSKVLITFIWEGITWHRYISDPTKGVQEPRVYLISAGDEPSSELPHPYNSANARMDAEGKVSLGIQAR